MGRKSSPGIWLDAGALRLHMWLPRWPWAQTPSWQMGKERAEDEVREFFHGSDLEMVLGHFCPRSS